MRGLARDLMLRVRAAAATMALRAVAIPALALLALIADARIVRGADGLDAVVHELNAQVFLEDEPILVCTAGSPGGASAPAIPSGVWRLICRTARGERIEFARERVSALPARSATLGRGLPAAAELRWLYSGPALPSDRMPLVPPLGHRVDFPIGTYELRRAAGDTARVLARFSIVPARGSESWVRAGVSRAVRLAGVLRRPDEAARLYEAIYARYPRTTYRSAVYLGLWHTRAFNRFGADPDRWMEEVFALFHDTSFGVFALDQFVDDRGPEAARPIVRRMAAVYTDTRMAQAAAGL